ncbi:MAG: BatD family protein [Mariprofundales bacterium]|nr:BatD family protein [Mariprofundales bacterium]
MKRIFLFFAVFMVLPVSAMATVLASLDRTQVEAGNSVQLTISRDSGDGDPNLAPLKRDFEIMGRSESSSYRFVNGHASSSKEWILTLMPKHSGRLTIPALKVGAQQTQPFNLMVRAAGTPPPMTPNSGSGAPGQGGSSSAMASQNTQRGNVFVQASAVPTHPKVQQQVIYTVRLYRAISLSHAQLSEPKIDHAVVVALGKDRNFEQVVNGRRYLVTERKYALYPQQRGQLMIKPLRFDGRALSTGSVFDPFNQMGRMVRKFSNPVTLQVDGVPATWPGGEWLPASRVTLSQTLSPGRHTAGEPITRTVELHADGLTSSQLAPVLNGVLPDGLKRYPDQPLTNDTKSDAGVGGMRREKVAIIPLHGGNFMLPGVDVPWWNVVTGKVEHATLPPQLIKVVAAPGSTASSAPSLTHLIPPLDVVPKAATVRLAGAAHHAYLWPIISLIILILWIITLVLWWSQRRGLNATPSPQKPATLMLSADTWAAKLRSSCRANDAPACAEAIRQWRRCIPATATISTELEEAITELQNDLYGSGHHWDPTRLLAAFESACQQMGQNGVEKSADTMPLAPLYPPDHG